MQKEDRPNHREARIERRISKSDRWAGGAHVLVVRRMLRLVERDQSMCTTLGTVCLQSHRCIIYVSYQSMRTPDKTGGNTSVYAVKIQIIVFPSVICIRQNSIFWYFILIQFQHFQNLQ